MARNTRFEKNVAQSFQNVRDDMQSLHNLIADMQYQLNECVDEIASLKKKLNTSNNTPQRFIASKKGKKAYPSHTIHAKNIKPENRLVFSTQEDALAHGFNV